MLRKAKLGLLYYMEQQTLEVAKNFSIYLTHIKIDISAWLEFGKSCPGSYVTHHLLYLHMSPLIPTAGLSRN